MLYLFLGKEEFLKRQGIKELKARHLGAAGAASFNYDEFNAADDDLNKIVDCAKTLPFMSKERLVVINGVDKINKQDPGKKQALISFIETRPKHAVIALTADLLKEQDELYQAAIKHGRKEDCHPYPLPGERLNCWIIKRFSELNKRPRPEAVKALQDAAGNNLELLGQAIDALAAYTGSSTAVCARDVEELIGSSLQATAFELADAIGAKDRRQALNILGRLNKEAGLLPKVLGALGSHMRKLWRVKKLVERGIPAQEAVQTAGVRYDKRGGFLRQVRNFSGEEIEWCFKALLKLDKAAKTSSGLPYRSLEILIMQACRVSSSLCAIFFLTRCFCV